jgi:hypothetical protein
MFWFGVSGHFGAIVGVLISIQVGVSLHDIQRMALLIESDDDRVLLSEVRILIVGTNLVHIVHE